MINLWCLPQHDTGYRILDTQCSIGTSRVSYPVSSIGLKGPKQSEHFIATPQALLIAFKGRIIRPTVPALAAAVNGEQRLHLERQAEELDEAVGVLLVV